MSSGDRTEATENALESKAVFALGPYQKERLTLHSTRKNDSEGGCEVFYGMIKPKTFFGRFQPRHMWDVVPRFAGIFDERFVAICPDEDIPPIDCARMDFDAAFGLIHEVERDWLIDLAHGYQECHGAFKPFLPPEVATGDYSFYEGGNLVMFIQTYQ